MVKVVCDTSFLISVASKKIKNFSSLDTEIGDLEFLVPDMVTGELERLAKGNSKKKALHLGLSSFLKDLAR